MRKSPKMTKMLSARELAKILGIHYETVLRLVKRGEIRAHRIGGLIRFSPENIQAFLNKAQESPHAT